MCADTYERSALLFKLKTVVAENIDDFIVKYGSVYRLIGHGSYFQSKYLNDPLVRVVWDYNSDFDFFVLYANEGIEDKKKKLLEESNKIVADFHTWLQPFITNLFGEYAFNTYVIEKPEFITVKSSINGLHLVDFTLIFENDFVHFDHPLDEITVAKDSTYQYWCHLKNANRQIIVDYARQNGLILDKPQLPLKQNIYGERNWIGKVVAWIIEKNDEEKKKLMKEIERLKKENAQMEKKSKEDEAEIARIKVKLKDKKEKIKTLKTANQKLETNQALIESQKKLVDDAKETKKQLERHKKDNERLVKDGKQLQKTHDELLQTYQKTKREFAKQFVIVQTMTKTMEKIKSDNANLQHDIDIYKQRANKLKIELEKKIKENKEQAKTTEITNENNAIMVKKLKKMKRNAMIYARDIDHEHCQIHKDYEHNVWEKMKKVEQDLRNEVEDACKFLVQNLMGLFKGEKLITQLESEMSKFIIKEFEELISDVKDKCLIYMSKEHTNWSDGMMKIVAQDRMDEAMKDGIQNWSEADEPIKLFIPIPCVAYVAS